MHLYVFWQMCSFTLPEHNQQIGDFYHPGNSLGSTCHQLPVPKHSQISFT